MKDMLKEISSHSDCNVDLQAGSYVGLELTAAVGELGTQGCYKF